MIKGKVVNFMKQEKKNNVALFGGDRFSAYVGCYASREDALEAAFTFVEMINSIERPSKVYLVFLNTSVIETLDVVMKVQLIETKNIPTESCT